VVNLLTAARGGPRRFAGTSPAGEPRRMNLLTSRSVVLVAGDLNLLHLVAAELRRALAEHLPDFSIQGESDDDRERAWAARTLECLRQLPN
jgi:hypothetical protein